jgi:hypothetical protein
VNSKIKFNATILVILFIIGGLFVIGTSGFTLLSGLRAYVGGEGLWAKGQKDAVYQLVLYVFGDTEARYDLFRERLQVPLGDKSARLELEKSNPVENIITRGFRAGGNHPDDIPTMILLYRFFQDTTHVRKAIEQWKIGDRLTDELLTVGEQIHRKIVSTGMSREQRRMALNTIDTLQIKLNEAENLFSHHMSAAARWSANVIFLDHAAVRPERRYGCALFCCA